MDTLHEYLSTFMEMYRFILLRISNILRQKLYRKSKHDFMYNNAS
jgi:hypothetical protein